MKPTFEVSWRRVTMSNMLRKIKRQSVPVFSMSLKVEWPKCKNFKLIPRETFQKMTEEEYQKGEIFLCNKCNIKMNLVSIEVDY